MRASFDGIRKALAHDFNELAKTELSEQQKEGMTAMRSTIAGMLCMYDSNDPDDCNDLIDSVKLAEIEAVL